MWHSTNSEGGRSPGFPPPRGIMETQPPKWVPLRGRKAPSPPWQYHSAFHVARARSRSPILNSSVMAETVRSCTLQRRTHMHTRAHEAAVRMRTHRHMCTYPHAPYTSTHTWSRSANGRWVIWKPRYANECSSLIVAARSLVVETSSC